MKDVQILIKNSKFLFNLRPSKIKFQFKLFFPPHFNDLISSRILIVLLKSVCFIFKASKCIRFLYI